MRKILKNLQTKDIFVLLFCVGLIVFQVWLDMELPKYMQKITTLLKTPGTEVIEIWKNGGFMLLCSLGSMASAILVGFFVSRLAAGFSMRLRANVFSCVESFSLEQIKRFSTASLITRTTNDVTQLQMVIAMGMQVLIKAPIIAIWAICEISSANWQCSIATGVAVAIMLTTISIAVGLALPKFKKMQTLTDNINNVTRENLEGSRVVRAFNAEGFEKQKFEKANDELTKTGLFTSRVMSIMSPMMGFVMSSLSLAIYWIGAIVISNMSNAIIPEKITAFGEIMTFSSYAMQVVMSFMMITMIFVILPRATVSTKRIAEVLNTKPTILSGNFDGETETSGEVEFKNVSFKYPDAEENILEDISFVAKKGETVAFIGSTGSGKSTLINLVPRFYDVTAGQILIDGVDIKEYNLKTLRNKIGYISQKAVMFSGTVTENLTFGQNGKGEPTDEELNEALSIACASNFVGKMEHKKESYIAQGGANISGGQKQRLSIARAVARKPEILIFDDSFSALDYKTDKKLRRNLDKKLNDTTRLIVAQRIGTIKDADKIIVLNDGKMVGIGTHKELLSTCEVYKEIALSQFSKEEIENELK